MKTQNVYVQDDATKKNKNCKSTKKYELKK